NQTSWPIFACALAKLPRCQREALPHREQLNHEPVDRPGYGATDRTDRKLLCELRLAWRTKPGRHRLLPQAGRLPGHLGIGHADLDRPLSVTPYKQKNGENPIGFSPCLFFLPCRGGAGAGSSAPGKSSAAGDVNLATQNAPPHRHEGIAAG